MFVDASVIVAILNQEPGWEELVKQLNGRRSECHVSPLVRFEAVMSVARAATGGSGRKPTPDLVADAAAVVGDFVAEIGAREMPISSEIGAIAIEAGMRYGKAVGHPADLNFGDCFAYACAKALGAPLLYKGDDFARTDLA
ncbi:type II toxin-antitoxin system VapC family toxin [Aminobacter sp. Piv2-1]|uniref:type II toxin-antitoxin system VapC family toxin n=1 Tax=Aminobacter sp. Piv2-1 TaxID=3031122 RepID=UPI0030A8F51C